MGTTKPLLTEVSDSTGIPKELSTLVSPDETAV